MKKIVMFALAALILCSCVGADDDDKKAKELAKVQILTNELLPKVAKATGMEVKHPVKVKIVDKAEVREFLIKSLEEDYPGDELERMTEAFVMIGLLPEGFNMKDTIVELMVEQAGAFYDPRTKTYYGIIDLPKQLQNILIKKILTAHELTHALQDQTLDMTTMVEKYKNDVDRSYANTALFEGQATVMMTSVVMGTNARKMPDIGKATRMGMELQKDSPEMKTLNSVPKYLAETLISPYAEGASFVQAFLKANPNAKVVDLFDRLPVTSEQILHYDKYEENDVPHVIDFSGLESVIPAGYEETFASTLGELEIRVLSSLNETTEEQSVEIGNGWDGIHFVVFKKGTDKFVVATSLWDSEKDAEEFAAAISTILGNKYDAESLKVEISGIRVSFVAGNISSISPDRIMTFLMKAPSAE